MELTQPCCVRAFGWGRSYKVTLTRGSVELAGQVASLILKLETGRGKSLRQVGKGSFCCRRSSARVISS